MRRLLQIGFEQVGSWRLRGQELALELTRMNGQRNVLYAFVQDASVLYVGKTTGPLESRMGGYLRPHASQRTNVRNNQALLHLLRQDLAIDIYAWADTGMHRIGDFHLNYAAGLEDSIIRIVTPPWNGARTAPPTAAAPDEPPLPPVPAIAEQPAPQSPAEGESASAIEVLALEQAGVIQASPVFEVVLGKTYYHNGFFNVPVKFSGLFPEHGTEISIYCGDSRTLIRATVDRKANQANHTPRIYGRGSLANWFGLYKRLDDSAIIRVASNNEIELM
jgi:hypothetical protein